MTRTKLICTIGPASIGRVDALAEAGMDVARINLSHGDADSHRAAADAVRRAETGAGRPLGILVDLAGPKIRLGELAGGSVELVAGASFALRTDDVATAVPGDAAGASVSDRALAQEVQPGDPIFLADGAAELRVDRVDDEVRTEVVRGGTIRSRAGVVIPAHRSSAPPLTDRDRADLRRIPELGPTFVGQSFVRAASDVVELRRALGPDGPAIVAKIETRPAVDDFDAILEVADGVMIARGDLGVELPYEEVPLIQKQLLRRALDRGVPSIVATQMLESMTSAPRPTRAEASDVANAVFDGADAVMLSGETAIGEHPIESAQAAERILARCEADGRVYLPAVHHDPPTTDREAIVQAAAALAMSHPEVAAIGCVTTSGRTARLLSALRPAVPIIAVSPDPAVVARLTLGHGVLARPMPTVEDGDQLGSLRRWLMDTGLVPDGAVVVLVGSSDSAGVGSQQLAIQRLDARDPGHR